MRIPKHVGPIAKIAPKDIVVSADGVHLTQVEEHCSATVTDGRRLLRLQWSDAESTTPNDNPFSETFDPAAVAGSLKMLPKRVEDPDDALATIVKRGKSNAFMIEGAGRNGVDKWRVELDARPGEYPNTDKYIEDLAVPDWVTVCINPTLLAELLIAMRDSAMDTENPTVRLSLPKNGNGKILMLQSESKLTGTVAVGHLMGRDDKAPE